MHDRQQAQHLIDAMELDRLISKGQLADTSAIGNRLFQRVDIRLRPRHVTSIMRPWSTPTGLAD